MRVLLVSLVAIITASSLVYHSGLIGNHNLPSAPSFSIFNSSPDDHPSWLIWTSSAAPLRLRREVIRSTWQSYYHPTTPFTSRFVISTPSDEWLPVIKQENDTYGDIIIISNSNHNENDKEFARTLKPFDMLVYLRDLGRKWDFVTKVDDDTFVVANKARDDFLVPHRDAKRTVITRVIQYARPHVFPSGQFYTLTWDLVELLANLYQTTTRDLFAEMSGGGAYGRKKRELGKRHEDFMIANLMVEAKEPFEYVELSAAQSFDVIDVKGGFTAVTNQAVNVHRMKSDEEYLWVAAMFDEKGFRGTELAGVNYEEKLEGSAAELRKTLGI
ncbi:uncharacterized protein KY384_001622 [Bacidia gigantensis]|uniref:uncharacterized protein n=1 Tax=Bacidia gigantensis TaxID=2732470 RepID=UPI001D04B2AC|nr:uncharacterized protein KY384_001622 [Bacidia gigantensis]KAG8533881.1 hypothetical protein KY384_001622 [Bacidia gigantensis]